MHRKRLQDTLQLSIILIPINGHIFYQICIFIGHNQIGMRILFFHIEIIAETNYLPELLLSLLRYLHILMLWIYYV